MGGTVRGWVDGGAVRGWVDGGERAATASNSQNVLKAGPGSGPARPTRVVDAVEEGRPRRRQGRALWCRPQQLLNGGLEQTDAYLASLAHLTPPAKMLEGAA
jgi:hypothetical protein